MTYTICKVHKKDEATEISSPGSDIDAHSLSLGTHMNNSGGEPSTAASEVGSISISNFINVKFSKPYLIHTNFKEPKNPHQLSVFFDKKQETELEEAIHGAFDNLSSYDWKYLLGDDEQSKTVSMQNSLIGVFDWA